MNKTELRDREGVWGPAVEALDNLFSEAEVDDLLFRGLKASGARGDYEKLSTAKSLGLKKVREIDLTRASNLIDVRQAAFANAYMALVGKYPEKEEALLRLLTQVGLDVSGMADQDSEQVEERLERFVAPVARAEKRDDNDMSPLQPL